jgi:tRNA-specific 2-thiouridylase
MKKSETREIAERLKLCNARKHDSQDICFIPDGDYVNFMEKYTGRHYPDGNFLDESGNVVGIHHGAVRYTIGQRKGLGLSMEEPVYVCEKDMQANTVTVGTESSMLVRGMMVGDLNWISVKGLSDRQYDGSLCECEITKVPSDDETGYDDFDMIHQTETKIWKPLHVSVRTRYHGSESGAMLYQDDGDRSKVRMIFDEPQKRAAVGQAAVFYDGDIVVGGGTIESMIL